MKKYAGIYNDEAGGLTDSGRIVMDAWVFEIIPGSETCAGWDETQMQDLAGKVAAAWARFDNTPANLPEDLRMRHALIYEHAMMRGRDAGWAPELREDE